MEAVNIRVLGEASKLPFIPSTTRDLSVSLRAGVGVVITLTTLYLTQHFHACSAHLSINRILIMYNELSLCTIYLPSLCPCLFQVNEELRLTERHLDLRTSFMQRNLRLRSRVAMAMREFLVHQHGKQDATSTAHTNNRLSCLFRSSCTVVVFRTSISYVTRSSSVTISRYNYFY